MPHENIPATPPIRILRPLETPPIPQALRMCTSLPAFLLGQARLSHPSAQLTIATAMGVPAVFNSWDPPAAAKPGDVMGYIETIERRIAAMVTLKMCANAMHHLQYAKSLGVYRQAVKAFGEGSLDFDDLADMGRGLSTEDRQQELVSVLGVGVG